MRKPAFGDVRAPRIWNNTAHESTNERNFIVHPLEHCLYLSTRTATRDDDHSECFQFNNEQRFVDGALGLHVYDFIGEGEGDSSERDTSSEKRGSDVLASFETRVQFLCMRFKFGSWKWHGICVMWRTVLAIVQSWCRRRQPAEQRPQSQTHCCS